MSSSADDVGKTRFQALKTKIQDLLLKKIDVTKIEDALIRLVTVGRHLFERLDQFGSTSKVSNQLRRRLTADVEKLIQARSPEAASRDFR